MNRPEARSALRRALEISRELAAAAALGDAVLAKRLDADRLQLLKAARALPQTDGDLAVLGEIGALNAQAIGSLQHGLRAAARDLDMMSVGRRAMRAYSATGLRR